MQKVGVQFCLLDIENEFVLVPQSLHLSRSLSHLKMSAWDSSFLPDLLSYTVSFEGTAMAPRHAIQREAYCHLSLFPVVFADTLECWGRLAVPTQGSGCSGWMLSCCSLEPAHVTLYSKSLCRWDRVKGLAMGRSYWNTGPEYNWMCPSEGR